MLPSLPSLPSSPSDPNPPANRVAVRQAREDAIARLSDAFAHDVIEVEEFERRLTLAHRAESPADIQAIVTDLDSDGASPASRAPSSRSRPYPCRRPRISPWPASGRTVRV
jgi:hypothetical protein